MESFYSIQGEGFHSGKAAYFIRLAGCDIGCSWCDVKDSWDAAAHPKIDISKIVTCGKESKSGIVVITGGEPLMYNLEELTQKLKLNGFQTHLETSGVYALTGSWDWICLSPKKFKKALPETIERADELKVIVYNKNDFSWAENMAGKVKADCKLFLQPEWSKSKEMLPQIISYVKNNPRWEISLQIHKFMDIP
ncbi:MAG: 7-carboxy-7-deazaguanine synthase QueE [Cyclobacteriaceae bacterium]|nr:7-carboxy-7-deazaguanine synthase QueE [Cyclobacteriaceae bacterium]